MKRQQKLRLFAGPRARQIIAERGIQASDFDWMAGASGGPKWFVLYGLDRYLAGEFFAGRRLPLRMIGSSAGAWRMACHAHSEPLTALDRLAGLYSTQTYSDRPDRHEVSREAVQMLAAVLADSGARDITHNPVFRVYLLADRMRGLLKSERKPLLAAGLAAAAGLNLAGRRHLRHVFERHVFMNSHEVVPQIRLQDLPTRFMPLTESNLPQALMASGSIPLVMESVRGVEGTAGAVYRDGGMTDYHLNLPFNQAEKLVLYPHFYARIVPGWFDRLAPWRRADPGCFDNVVMLVPSKKFVQSLPYGKIPDRSDFQRLEDGVRITYWQKVLEASKQLADDFDCMVNTAPGALAVESWAAWKDEHV